MKTSIRVFAVVGRLILGRRLCLAGKLLSSRNRTFVKCVISQRMNMPNMTPRLSGIVQNNATRAAETSPCLKSVD